MKYEMMGFTSILKKGQSLQAHILAERRNLMYVLYLQVQFVHSHHSERYYYYYYYYY